ncbi:trypco2 family protein [Streptomyces sp. NPDC101151]|uniref:trypco2 family protein n=1 Tax=Streptomyces sp. NPDC101151 TaxID=3366115 RepID=UPI00381B8385
MSRRDMMGASLVAGGAVGERTPDGVVGLAEAVNALREELQQAWSSSEGARLRFRPSPVELTVQVAVTKAVGGSVKAKWWLVELGGDSSRSSVTTQTLKLTLDPVGYDPDGNQVDFLISDAEMELPPDVGELPLDDGL